LFALSLVAGVAVRGPTPAPPRRPKHPRAASEAARHRPPARHQPSTVRGTVTRAEGERLSIPASPCSRVNAGILCCSTSLGTAGGAIGDDVEIHGHAGRPASGLLAIPADLGDHRHGHARTRSTPTTERPARSGGSTPKASCSTCAGHMGRRPGRTTAPSASSSDIDDGSGPIPDLPVPRRQASRPPGLVSPARGSTRCAFSEPVRTRFLRVRPRRPPPNFSVD